jgi:hypothetical protein
MLFLITQALSSTAANAELTLSETSMIFKDIFVGKSAISWTPLIHVLFLAYLWEFQTELEKIFCYGSKVHVVDS